MYDGDVAYGGLENGLVKIGVLQTSGGQDCYQIIFVTMFDGISIS